MTLASKPRPQVARQPRPLLRSQFRTNQAQAPAELVGVGQIQELVLEKTEEDKPPLHRRQPLTEPQLVTEIPWTHSIQSTA